MKKILVVLLAFLCVFLTLVGCDNANQSGGGSSQSNSGSQSASGLQSNSGSQSTGGSQSGSGSQSTGGSQSSTGSQSGGKTETVAELKAKSVEYVNSLYSEQSSTFSTEQKFTANVFYNYLLEQIEQTQGTYEQISAEIENYKKQFESIMTKLNGTVQSAKDAYDMAVAEIDSLYKVISSYITEAQKQDFELLFSQVKEKIKNATKESIENTLAEFKNEVFDYVKSYVSLNIDELKMLAKKGVDSVEKSLTSILSAYDDLVNRIKAICEEQKAKIDELTDETQIKDAVSSLTKIIKDEAEKLIKEQISKFKANAKAKIDELINNALTYVEDATLKKDLNDFYNKEIAELEKIENIETAKTAFAKIEADTKTFVEEQLGKQIAKLKEAAKSKIDELVNNALTYVEDTTLRKYLNDFYNKEIAELEKIENIETSETAFAKIETDTKTFVEEQLGKQIAKLKVAAKSKIDELVNNALTYVEDTTLRKDLNDFYNKEITELEKIENIETAKTAFTKIETDTKAFVEEQLGKQIAKLKANAKAKIDELYYKTTEGIDDKEIKSQLDQLYEDCCLELNSIKDIESAKTAFANIQDKMKTGTQKILKSLISSYVENAKKQN